MTDFIGRGAEIEAALDALEGNDGFLVTGADGVGRTRLLEEVLIRHAARGGHHVTLATGTGGDEIPFAGFLHLLPDDSADELPDLAVGVRSRLLELACERPLVLAVDDVHELDAASIGMLQHLLGRPEFRVAATLRSGEARPDGLDQLWYDADVTRLDLSPFDETEVASLAEAALGAPVQASLSTAVAEATAGNARLASALIADARDSGALGTDGSGWAVAPDRGPLLDATGPRTYDCVERMSDRLDGDQRRLLRLVAIAGSLHPEVVPNELRHALERLEERGGVDVVPDPNGGFAIRVRQPVVGSVVRRTTPTSTRFALLEDLLALTRGTATDPTHVAAWAEEIGAPLSAYEWLDASDAAMAAFDRTTARRWAERARDADPSSHAAHRSLGRLQRLDGDMPAAMESFRSARSTATGDDEVALAAIDLAGLVAFDLHDPASALDDLLHTADRVDDPAQSLALRSEAAVMASLLGRFDDVLVSRPSADELATADGPTRWLLGLNEVYASTMLGRVANIDRIVESTRGAFRSVAGERPQELDFLHGLHSTAMLQRGELRRVLATTETWDRRRSADEYRGVHGFVLALVAREVGDVRAAEFAADACDQHGRVDPLGTAPIALAAASLIAADSGDLRTARDLGERSTDVGAELWRTIWSGRALARVAHRDGDRADAVRRCTAAAQAALDASHHAYAAVTAHDLVEYGEPATAARLLAEAIESTEGGDFLSLLLRHAEASARDDVDALASCGSAFSRLGAARLEAMCHERTMDIALADGDVVRARWAEALARRAVDRLATMSVRIPTVDDALTDREREIAFLAASDATSRTIAEALGLSARTVDNHLRRVYRKLGVGGRGELRALDQATV